MDYLQNAEVKSQELSIGKESFKALVIPYGEYIPMDVIKKVLQIAKEGVKVIFVNEFPKEIIPMEAGILEDINAICTNVALSELSVFCDSLREIRLENPFSDCVYYHYEQKDADYYMFFNESVSETLTGKVNLPEYNYYYEYDAFSNQLYNTDCNLNLSPYESTVFVCSNTELDVKQKRNIAYKETETLNLNWRISYASAKEYPEFTPIGELAECKDVRTFEQLENKTGTVRYETCFDCKNFDSNVMLELENAWEVAEVFVNGKSAGVRICGPYCFDLTGLLKEKENKIAIEVTNTLGNQQRDAISQYLVIEPFGITGKISLNFN
jgi:hypothetical protein